MGIELWLITVLCWIWVSGHRRRAQGLLTLAVAPCGIQWAPPEAAAATCAGCCGGDAPPPAASRRGAATRRPPAAAAAWRRAAAWRSATTSTYTPTQAAAAASTSRRATDRDTPRHAAAFIADEVVVACEAGQVQCKACANAGHGHQVTSANISLLWWVGRAAATQTARGHCELRQGRAA